MADTTNEQEKIAQSVILDVRRGSMSLSRKVESSRFEVKADLEPDGGAFVFDDPLTVAEPKKAKTSKEYTKHSKLILPSDFLCPITRVDAKIKGVIEARAFSTPWLRHGTYFLPSALVEETDRLLQELVTERNAAVEEILARYEQEIAKMPERLGTLFDPSEYPGADEIRARFSVKIVYMSYSAPEQLAKLSTGIWERERKRAEEEYRQMLGDIEQQLIAGAYQWIRWVEDKMTEAADGKPKVIRQPSMEKLREFFDLLGARNETGNARLAEVATKSKAILDRIGLEQLKANKYTRAAVLERMQDIRAVIEPIVVDKTSRLFTLDDNDEPTAKERRA